MTKADNRLVKIMLIYEFLYITDNKTKIAQGAVKTLRKYLSNVLTYQETLYRASESKKKDIYSKSWDTVFGAMETSRVISIGIFIQSIYESDNFKDVIGDKKMDKVLSSFFFSNTVNDEAIMEKNSNLLAKEVLKLLDGEKELTPFQKRMKEIKNV